MTSEFNKKINMGDYVDLYRTGMELERIKPLKNQTYKLFSQTKVGIRIVPRESVYKNPLAFNKIKHFVNNNEYFYMIPVTTIKETIVGFILRGVTRSDYSTVSREFSDYEKKVPLMYGFNKSFRKFDKHTEKYGNCLPIIICEGSKDCLMLKKIYPFVLANNTSSMGVNAQILRNISNKFLLAYDNDKAGQDGIKRDKAILRGMGALVDNVKLDEGFKDCSDYLDDPVAFAKLSKQIKRKLKLLYHSN